MKHLGVHVQCTNPQQFPFTIIHTTLFKNVPEQPETKVIEMYKLYSLRPFCQSFFSPQKVLLLKSLYLILTDTCLSGKYVLYGGSICLYFRETEENKMKKG